MLSKATKFCFSLPLRGTQTLPFSHLFSSNSKILSSLHTKSPLFNKAPLYFFSNENTEKPDKTLKKKPKVKIEEETDEESEPDLVDFMRKDPKTMNIKYEYNTKTLFEVHTKKEDFTKRYMFYWGMGTIWGIVSFLTFNYINPWAALIPVWFLSGSLMTIRMASKFQKGMIKKIELVDNKHINIYPLHLKGKGVLCDISKTEMLGIKVMSESPQEDGKSVVKSYLILANFQEANKKKNYNKMRLLIDPKLTSVASIDLLKSILYGNIDEVENYTYVEKKADENEVQEQEKKERDRVDDAEGIAKFEFKDEEFDELRKQLNRNIVEEETKTEKDKEEKKE